MKKIIVIALSFLILFVAASTVYYVSKTDQLKNNEDNIIEDNDKDTQNNSQKNDFSDNNTDENDDTNLDTNEGEDAIDSNVNENIDDNIDESNDEVLEDNKEDQEVSEIEYSVPTLEQLKEQRVNENGTIFVLMFHGFITEDMADTYNDKEYTMTLKQFRKTLETLFELDYRPISMNDMLTGNIDVPLGKIPVVFTFDDARSGQFSFVEENGELVVNKNTAIYVWQEFAKENPEFEMRGTFYVNLGRETFGNVGTLKERLTYMIEQGFEIGNHTYSHDYLKNMETPQEVIYQIGKNQKVMEEIIEGYKFTSLALPYGEDVSYESLKDYVVSGKFEGVEYDNLGVLDCKWRPSPSVFNEDFNERLIYRVRADGLEPVECDLSYWLRQHTSKRGQYVSDGNPEIVSVPTLVEESFDKQKATSLGKEINIYVLD